MSEQTTNPRLTTGQCARMVGVCRSTVQHWIDSGMLKGFRMPGGYRRVLKDDLLAFCRRHGVPVNENGESGS